MEEICTDNRIIAEYKQKLIDGTNIETSPEEMAVIDNILFRFWQMGWLNPNKTNADRIRAMTDEELASSLAIEYWKLPKCNSVYGENEECFQPDCTGCWLDWLKEEVEE